MKKLSEILGTIEHEIFSCDTKSPINENDINDIQIENLVFDSRDVKEKSLFFALPGNHTNGNEFIADAVEKGADAIIFEGEVSKETQTKCAKIIAKRHIQDAISSVDKIGSPYPAFIKVKNARFSMAPVSAAFFDEPSKNLVVIGVTGTEGKSSTVSFIWQLLRLCGKKAGFISTVEYSFGDEALPNPQHQTTPEAPIIQHHLAEMVKNGCEYAVVEASSHGLSEKLNRLGCVLFDCGVFMNVTLEHLEFHKTFEQYRHDKANLFRKLDENDHEKIINGKKRKVQSIGIVNFEDESAEYFASQTKKHIYGWTTFGQAGKAAGESAKNAKELPKIPEHSRFMQAKNIAHARGGIDFLLETDGENAVFPENYDKVLPRSHKNIKIHANLPGAFNAYNLMASITAVSSVTGLTFEEIAKHTKDLMPIKGRMTEIDEGQPFEVIVDYAHTPSSFETIFPPLRKRCTGRMFSVFGSGGERDKVKRPLQGEIAARFCDVVVLADEDPRGEDPVELLKEIASGAEKCGKIIGENLFIIHDRKLAIRETFKMAKKGDIVLLLGKSHENSIIYKDFVMPYDEITEAKTALGEME